MGGLITRQMLMTERPTLESHGMEIARVITLGTPHQGTHIATPGLGILFVRIMNLFYNQPWITDVFAQMAPAHDFITTLNADPMSYSSGIEWYTFSAISYSGWADIMLLVHLDANDVPVASGRAHLSFATQTIIPDCEHNQLIDDIQQRTYADISTWLAGGIDSDNDGLLDVEERRVYSTDINDSDSDNDGISDGDEVHIYGTNPNYWNTDGDVISDGNEVAWGYDPLNANSPIPASSLISSVSVITSSRTVKVYVNHYPAMDYVKFYVKYKTKFGSWTSYSYMGSDYTPTTNGDYYDTWTHPTVYTRMMVMVKAYDSYGHWLGSDYHTSGINPGGGGGGDPPPI